MPKLGDLGDLGILFTLLPGFLTYLVQHALTSLHQRLETARLLLWSLAYTLIVNAIWYLASERVDSFLTSDLVGLTITAVLLGVVLSPLSSSGLLFTLARKCRLSNQPSWGSVWRTTFNEARRNRVEWAVLYLRDGRRLYGCIYAVSPVRDGGHVLLKPAMWLPATDKESVPTQFNAAGFLVHASDVGIIELISTDTKELRDGREESAGVADGEAGGVVRPPVRSGTETPAPTSEGERGPDSGDVVRPADHDTSPAASPPAEVVPGRVA